MKYSKEWLDAVLGPGEGNTIAERAVSNNVMFVRGQDQIAIDSEKAWGLKMTATEVLECFGEDLMAEVCDEGVALLVCHSEEPARSLRNSRIQHGWSVEELAEKARVTVEQVNDAENSTTRTLIHILKPIADALGLDWRLLSWKPLA